MQPICSRIVGTCLLAAAFCLGVSRIEDAEAQLGDSALTAHLESARAAKDSLLRYGPDSPLREADRADFGGLNYFAVDPRFRLTGDLHRYGRQRRVLVPTTGDTLLHMDRFGRLVLEFEGNEFWLEVYANPGTGDLSVYFTDRTNGRETYGGGRYSPVQKLDQGTYLIDFNRAYNPYCAYNPDYICPLPPPQNHLLFPVSAGERSYGPDLAH